jgi:hypothetical protein
MRKYYKSFLRDAVGRLEKKEAGGKYKAGKTLSLAMGLATLPRRDLQDKSQAGYEDVKLRYRLSYT